MIVAAINLIALVASGGGAVGPAHCRRKGEQGKDKNFTHGERLVRLLHIVAGDACRTSNRRLCAPEKRCLRT